LNHISSDDLKQHLKAVCLPETSPGQHLETFMYQMKIYAWANISKVIFDLRF